MTPTPTGMILEGFAMVDGVRHNVRYDSTRCEAWSAEVDGGELRLYADDGTKLVELLRHWRSDQRFSSEPPRDTALRVEIPDGVFVIAFRSPTDGLWRVTGESMVRSWTAMREWIGEHPCWRESGEEWDEVPTTAQRKRHGGMRRLRMRSGAEF